MCPLQVGPQADAATGVSAGLRRIERQDLEENTLEVAKPAPAQEP